MNIWELVKGAWAGLDTTGRTVVLITLFVVAGILLSVAMYLRYDLSWLPALLQ